MSSGAALPHLWAGTAKEFALCRELGEQRLDDRRPGLVVDGKAS